VDTNAWIAELGTADFSIIAWIKTRDAGAAILGKGNEDRNWDFHEKQFYLSAGTEQGQPVAGGLHFYGNQAGEIWGATAVNDGTWHHVCVNRTTIRTRNTSMSTASWMIYVLCGCTMAVAGTLRRIP